MAELEFSMAHDFHRRPTTRKARQSLRAHARRAIGAALVFRAVLDYSYVTYVSRHFAGDLAGGMFAFSDIDVLRLSESYVMALVLAAWLVLSLHRRARPSGIALVLYFVVVILPLSSVYGLSSAPAPFLYAVGGSFAVLVLVTGSLPRVKIPQLGKGFASLGITCVAVVSAYVYGWLILSGGLGRMSFDLSVVYEVRAEYARARWPLIGYLLPWQAHVVNMLIFSYALHRKNWSLMGLTGAAQLLLFGMTGHRSFLLTPIMVGGVYSVWSSRNALLYVFGGASLLVLATYGWFLLKGDHLLSSLLIRRLFFTPAWNHLIYYDFFSRPTNPAVMLSNSVLSPFLRYPYDMGVTRLIAWAYWGRDFNPNVGYLGDAFAQFGFVGMIVFSVILGGMLRVLDSVGSRLPPNLVAAVVATPAVALVNSALFTSFLTHGLILAGISIWFLRSVDKSRRGVKTPSPIQDGSRQHRKSSGADR